MTQLFNDSAYVTAHIGDPAGLMAGLFELHGISQSSYGQPDLGFLFTDEERYDLWQRNNFEWYYEKGPSPLSDGGMFTQLAGKLCDDGRYGHCLGAQRRDFALWA